MIRADYFICQIIPQDTFIKVIRPAEYLTSTPFFTTEDYVLVYIGVAKNIDYHFVSSYDVIKVEPKAITEYHNDNTATVYPNALEITVN